jgi:ferredoxin
MARPKWFIKLLMQTFPTRFLLAKLTRIPVFRYIIDILLFKDDDIYFIPKDNTYKKAMKKTIGINKKIQQQTDIILPSKIVHDFIDKANYHWIMNFCFCRTSVECENYPKEFGCLFLGEAVKNIDPDFGDMVSKEEAHKYVEECREKGLVHLIGRNKLDAQWLDVKPSSKLLTICNCCECCCLWKMIPDLDLKISRKITKLPGIDIKVNKNCIGCGTCLEDICFVNAISMYNKKATINQQACRGCGRCIEICPNNAIDLLITDDSFIEKTENKLAKSVDVS